MRLEYTRGSSNKFWEVAVGGNCLVVSWGRIGTAGQSMTKVFKNESGARAAMRVLVEKKLAKGYVDVEKVKAARMPVRREGVCVYHLSRSCHCNTSRCDCDSCSRKFAPASRPVAPRPAPSSTKAERLAGGLCPLIVHSGRGCHCGTKACDCSQCNRLLPRPAPSAYMGPPRFTGEREARAVMGFPPWSAPPEREAPQKAALPKQRPPASYEPGRRRLDLEEDDE